MSMEALIAYVPVIHRGYLDWLNRHPSGNVFVLSDAVCDEFDLRRKDIRALRASETVGFLRLEKSSVDEATPEVLRGIPQRFSHILMPDEDISHFVAERYLVNGEVEFEKTFLRYDSKRSLARVEIQPDEEVSSDSAILAIMGAVKSEGEKSSDWWRQVGAALVSDGNIVLLMHNDHVPTPDTILALGDPRANFKKGLHIDVTTALHAEGAIFAKAAALGISTTGADLFVSTFPCPICANSIAFSGIRTMYYSEGYSMLEGQDLLRSQRIKIIKVL